jgi:CheY-like chemotaxis protein
MALPPLVLLVDDTSEILDVYGEALVDDGLRVWTARDGLEALQQARILQPDVIVLDFDMPGMNGLEVTRRLKADPRTQAVPVILFTGEDRKLDGDALAAGCADVVGKPCRLADLVAAIRAQLPPHPIR